MKVLIIDNYDSFTFNLYQYIGEVLTRKTADLNGSQAFEVLVKRNDELTLEQIKALKPDRIIISPGPGSPENPDYFGVCRQVITELGQTTPLLGICLGMQGIAYAFGGEVVRAPVPMHGKTSDIQHSGTNVFKGLPQPLEIMRYHSLMVNPKNLPDCLEMTAVVSVNNHNLFDKTITQTTEIMGIKHNKYPIQGVQFHPESILSEHGHDLLRNFIAMK